MTKGKMIKVAITWLVVVGVIAFMAMGIYDVSSKTQYFCEVRSQFVNEINEVTKLAQIFELPQKNYIKYNKNVLTVELIDYWYDSIAGVKVKASYQIEGENVTLVESAASIEIVDNISSMALISVCSLFVGIILTRIAKEKSKKK